MKNEIELLIDFINEQSLDAYLVTSEDCHSSEYPHPHFKFRQYLSGFTGSNGTLLVTKDSAFLWTDSRYFIQAEDELEGSGIELFKLGTEGVPDIISHIKSVMPDGGALGADLSTIKYDFGRKLLKELAGKEVSLVNIDAGRSIWPERPAFSSSNNVWFFDEKFAGEKIDIKLNRLKKAISALGAKAHIISSLDDIAWVLNLRGNDTPYTPVFYSYLIVTKEKTYLYAFEDFFSVDVCHYLSKNDVLLRPYESFFDDVAELVAGSAVLLDPAKTSFYLYNKIKDSSKVLLARNPSENMKAIKNKAEIKALRGANILDGIAMTRFIYNVKEASGSTAGDGNCDNTAPFSKFDELSLKEYLDELREQVGAIEPSFETICGYGEHGAIVHYSVDEKSNARIKPGSFLLVDSGGHYARDDSAGTTDITRTIAIGQVTETMSCHYTLVLKGMLDLAMAKFPKGTNGATIDAFAHRYLWEQGLDYGHGTGHGIGFCSCVHEGPQGIHRSAKEPFAPGMVTSDEPGLYIEGEYGIRLENDLLCVKSESEGFYEFETLTLCPFDRDAIMTEMLSEAQLEFLNAYHERVYETLAPYLSESEKVWLREATLPL